MPISPTEYTYPFDPTGTAPSNKVSSEVHVITQQNHRDYSFIIPTFAPYFAEGLTIFFTDASGNPVPLVEGQDYYFGHHFLAASRAISKQVYGSISFINKDFKGVMSLSYQTLGGKWTYDQAYLNQLMTNIISNPRISSWDSIVELPGLFPVIDHEWNLIDMVGMSHVVAGLFGIEEALRDPTGTGTGGGSGSQLMDHILNNQNPHHVTKLQVGLGNVPNYGMATQSDAETGIADSMFMSPILVKQAITFQATNPLNAHIARTDNPHNTTPAQVGLGNVQNYPIATQAEAQAGTANDRYMTALRVKEAITALANGAIDTHKADTNNPHATTKTQVGLGNVDNFKTATDVEALTGTSNTTFVTPSLVSLYVSSVVGTGVGEHLTDYNNPHRTTAALVGAYTTLQTDALLNNKLSTSATAADSFKLQNLTVAELTAQILLGKAATAGDADTLNGKSYLDIINSITTGTASNTMRLENKTLIEVLALAAAQDTANALKLDGLTLQQLFASIPGSADVSRQHSYDAVPALVGATNLWTNLFEVTSNNVSDVQAFVVGGASAVGTDGFMYYIKADPRDNYISVLNMNGVDSTVEFGSTLIDMGGGINKLQVWMKSNVERHQVAITELTNMIAIFPDSTPRAYMGADSVGANVVGTLPAGYTPQAEINEIKNATTHIARTDNPHATTKAQVGLGNVDDYATATLADAQAGTATNLFMTPALVKDAITQFASGAITSHTGRTDNPHSVTKAQVGLGSVPDYAVATQAEAEAGVTDTAFMTPLKTAEAIVAQVGNRTTIVEAQVSQILTDLTTLFTGLTV